MASFSTETETNSDGDFPTGRASVEQSQGYEAMPMAIPDAPADEGISSDEITKVLREDREDLPQPGAPEITRNYFHQGGKEAGEPRPPHETVPIDRAARDLANMREQEDALKLAELERSLIERLDGEATASPDAVAPVPEQVQLETPQPEAPEQAAQPDVFEDPRVIAAVQDYTARMTQANEATRQAYVQQLSDNALAASAALMASFPELGDIRSPERLAGALQLLQRTNPERANQLKAYLSNVQTVTNQAREAQQQQAQAHQAAFRQQWEQAAQQSDQVFDQWANAQDTPDRVNEIKSHAVQLLKSEGNLTDAQIKQYWESDPTLRSAMGQKLLYMATKYALGQQAIKSKVSRPVPRVSPPTSPMHRAADESIVMRNLSQKLDKTESVESARDLLIARRNARR